MAEVSSRAGPDGALRAPVFLRLRDDVDVKQVRRPQREPQRGPTPMPTARMTERRDRCSSSTTTKSHFTLAVGRHHIKLTNLDRVYWPANPALKQPALTKRDLLRYFAQVSPYMLPHLADRPLTMIRIPDGIDGQRFFQKHWEQAQPDFVETSRCARTTRTSSTSTCCATTCRRCSGWRSPAPRVPRLAFAHQARPGPRDATPTTPRSLESLEASVAELPRLRALRHRPVHLLGEGGAGRRSPSSTPSPSRRARRSPSGCASSCRPCRSSRS